MTRIPLPTVDPQAVARLAALRASIDGEVRTGRHDRMLYATDASIYQVEPLAVVIPSSVADVERTIAWCAEEGLPMLPRGGGTSLAGQTVNRAVVIDASRALRRIVAIDAARRRVRVEPGVVLDQLNRALAPHGLRFGPDVATSTHATLGGMIGNNSAGANSILYGRTVENVRALEVVFVGGLRARLEEGASERDPRLHDLTWRIAEVVLDVADEIDRRFPKTRRRVDGYNLDLLLAQLRASAPGTFDRVNLAHLVCGSEGTLACTVEAELDAVPLPTARGLAIVAFASVQDALESVNPLLETGPAAVELVDDVIIRLARANIECRRYVDLLPQARGGGEVGAVLYVEHYGDSDAEVDEKLAAVARRFGDDAVQRHRAPDAILRAWKLRKAGEPLLHGLPGLRKPVTFIEDTAVDPVHLPEFIRRFRAAVERHGTIASFYAHASVGCLHVRPLVNLRDPADFEIMHAIMREVTDLVIEYGGALSGEHGDGRLRSHQLEQFYGPRIVEAFRRIKGILDPRNLLNPGNIVDPPPMDRFLRVRPDEAFTTVPDVRTFFRYDREHGFDGAVEMCNGAGVCRKVSGGTMCPSYRATLDERHSTRGRGNALRLAITGQLGADGAPAWDDPETKATLELCLSCKACKAECPSNVDVAKLKAEYLAQGHRAAGRVPLGARLVGHVRTLNRLGAVLPAAANLVAGLAPVRTLLERVAGLDRRRPLPRLARPWSSRGPEAAERDLPADAPRVLLFADCFTNWNEPEIGHAARRLLAAFGYRTVVADAGCCGRSLISVGMLPQAAAAIARTATALEALVERERPAALLVLEPSCLSAIVDDWIELECNLPAPRIAHLAALTSSVEDFLVARWDTHPRRPERRPGDGRPIVVHGHCHQKALVGAGGAVELLRRLIDAPVELLDTGCCGMAGSFGYRSATYDVSVAVAETSLVPELTQRPDAEVVACGTSCRHQVHDLLGRRARHVVETATGA